jgi:hypothetical protein
VAKSPSRAKKKKAGTPAWRNRAVKAVGVAVPVLFFGAILCAPMLRSDSANARSPKAARGYVAIVNQVLGPMNWLLLRESDPDAPTAEASVELSPEALSHPEVVDFYVRSPLIQDIAARDGQRWDIRGRNVLGLDPAARAAPDPFPHPRWTGDLLYADTVLAANLYDDRGHQVEIVPAHGQVGTFISSVSIEDDKPQQTFQQQFRLIDESQNAIADLRLIGRNLVIYPQSGASGRLTVDTPNGKRTASFGPDARDRAIVMVEGGTLQISRDGRVLRTYRLGSMSAALSAYRPFAGRYADPSMNGLADTIQSSFQYSGQSGSTDRRITLDRDLHQNMQTRLASFVGGLPRHQNRSIRAAATVMDTMTGEVLSLASFPLDSDEPGGREAERNNNFNTLPIGSVAKVPVSAAILTQFPGLRFLQINNPGPFETMLGIDMEGKQDDLAPTGWLNFTQYIAHSSNSYATMLVMMGLSQDPFAEGPCPAGTGYRLGNAAGEGVADRQFAPQFVLPRVTGVREARCGDRFQMPVGGALSARLRQPRPGVAREPERIWVGLLGELFDLPGVENPPGRYALDLWPGVAEQSEAAKRAFPIISPEQESFELGKIQHFHNDYVNLILGGVHSRWTTIKVAEIYSRVVTGQAIKATMLHRPDAASASELSLLNPFARESLMAGMRSVVLDGTARSYLAPSLSGLRAAAGQNHEEIRVFAKTGTPTVARTREVPGWVVLSRLEAKRQIVLRDGVLAVAAGAPGESDYEALRKTPGAEAEARRMGLSLRRLASDLYAMRIELSSRRREIGGLYGHINLPIVQTLPDPPGSKSNNGGAIAIVLGRYCPGDPETAAPRKGLTLVINIQAKLVVNPASQFAGLLLQSDSPLVRRLFAEPLGCPVAPAPVPAVPVAAAQ